jgi:hypothetical protein
VFPLFLGASDSGRHATILARAKALAAQAVAPMANMWTFTRQKPPVALLSKAHNIPDNPALKARLRKKKNNKRTNGCFMENFSSVGRG